MLLLGSEDDSHEELQSLAKQVICRFEDMVPAPDKPGAFRLPQQLLPAPAVELFKCFYDRKREDVFKWAKSNGILIGKEARFGPQLILLQRGEVVIGDNQISFSIVVPGLHKAQPIAAVSITSPIGSNIAAHSRPELEPGHVLILEAKERLAISSQEKAAVEAPGLCLVSALHAASFVGQGKGGWKEDIKTEEEDQTIA